VWNKKPIMETLSITRDIPRLLLFDVNGFLCIKVNSNIEGSIRCSKSYNIIIRPGIVEFLRKLSTRYTIGIFSSTTFNNIQTILECLTIHYREFISIIADRSVTSLDPGYNNNNSSIKSFDTVKRLDRFLEHPILNKDRIWNSSNVLIIDHERLKLRFNSEKNILLVKEFIYDDYINNTVEDLSSLIERINDKFK
jgi:hypothetical protein